jgi:hypothetical protein
MYSFSNQKEDPKVQFPPLEKKSNFLLALEMEVLKCSL